MKPSHAIYFVGVIFSPLAALMAFLVTYNEYTHHYASKREPLKIALEAAVFALAVFVVLGVLVGLLLSRLFQEG